MGQALVPGTRYSHLLGTILRRQCGNRVEVVELWIKSRIEEGQAFRATPEFFGAKLATRQIRLPFGEGKTSPVAVEDVARVIAALLANPQPHIGRIYHLTGP